MITELSEREYKELTDAAEGQTLDAILCYSVPDIHPAEFSFADRREIFLGINPSSERRAYQTRQAR